MGETGGLVVVCFCVQIRGICQFNFPMEQPAVFQWTPTLFSNRMIFYNPVLL
jgi:hypothetical protein